MSARIANEDAAVYGNSMVSPTQPQIVSGGNSLIKDNIARHTSVGMARRIQQTTACPIFVKENIDNYRFENLDDTNQILFNATATHKLSLCSSRIHHTLQSKDLKTSAPSQTVEWSTNGCCAFADIQGQIKDESGNILGGFIAPGCCSMLCSCCSCRVGEITNTHGVIDYYVKSPTFPCLTSTQMHVLDASEQKILDIKGSSCLKKVVKCLKCYASYSPDAKMDLSAVKTNVDRERIMLGAAFFSSLNPNNAAYMAGY